MQMTSVKHQSGAVLFVGLIMVLVLSILVVASTRTTLLQQKMTANLRDKDLSFQAAESALRTAETYLQQTSVKNLSVAFDNANGLYQFNQERRLEDVDSWSDVNSKEVDGAYYQIRQKPVYLIEELPPIIALGNTLESGKPVNSHYYRVTSKSMGGTDSSVTILQSTYKK